MSTRSSSSRNSKTSRKTSITYNDDDRALPVRNINAQHYRARLHFPTGRIAYPVKKYPEIVNAWVLSHLGLYTPVRHDIQVAIYCHECLFFRRMILFQERFVNHRNGQVSTAFNRIENRPDGSEVYSVNKDGSKSNTCHRDVMVGE